MFLNNNIKSSKKQREFKFLPRIINPVKIKNVVVFSADEHIRQAKCILKQNMPWLNVCILSDPVSVANFKSKEATVFLFDDTALIFTDIQKIKQDNKDSIIILLSLNTYIQCSPPLVTREKYLYTAKADMIFAFDQKKSDPEPFITAVVRCAEDQINIKKYSKARRFIFLIVDDEPRWYSQFLPVLYSIIGQRADIMLTRTYEDALKFLFGVDDESKIDSNNYMSQGYGDDVVCVITDIFFQKEKKISSEAGVQLFNLISKYYPRIPIMIASKAKTKFNFRDIAFVMPKGSPDSLRVLRGYIHDFTGMGDFILRFKTGKIYRRIRNIEEMHSLLLEAEKKTDDAAIIRNILDEYADKDYFSTWLYMHGFRELADQLRPKHHKGQRLITVLKRILKRELLRMSCTPIIINSIKINQLQELSDLFSSIDPVRIQQFSDHDIFSTWFDRKGYPELAEEFRPIHGSGAELVLRLQQILKKWIILYKRWGRIV